MNMEIYLKEVFEGVLSHEGHEVRFHILESYVEVTNTNGAMISVNKVDTDKAIEQQKDLIGMGYKWII